MDDLISRKEAIDALSKAMPSLTTPDGCGQFDREIYVAQETFVDAMQIIHDLPSAEPRHGKWVYHYRLKKFVCLECGYEQKHKPEWKYCPNCGARMDK